MSNLPEHAYVYRRGLFWVAEYPTTVVLEDGWGKQHDGRSVKKKRFVLRSRAESFISARFPKSPDNEVSG